MDVAVTDAHALIWAATGSLRKLGKNARRFYERVEAGEAALYVPTHVLLEIGEAHVAGDFSLGVTFDDWISGLTSSARYVPVDLTTEIVMRSHELYEIPERGDRIVVATALVYDCPLISRDPEIAKAAKGLSILW